MSWYVICVQHTCYSIVLAHATFTFMTILVSSWFNTNMSLTCLPSCHIQQIEDVARRLQDQGVVLMGYCNLDAYLGNVQQLETGNRWKCNKGKNKGSEGTHLRRAVTFLWIVCESTSSCLIPFYISLHEVIIGSYDLTVRHEPSYSCHIFCTCFLHVHWDLVTFSTAQQVSSCAAAFGRCPRPWAAFSMSKRSSLCSAWIIPKPVLYFNVLHKCCLHFPFRHVVNVSYYSYFRACFWDILDCFRWSELPSAMAAVQRKSCYGMLCSMAQQLRIAETAGWWTQRYSWLQKRISRLVLGWVEELHHAFGFC